MIQEQTNPSRKRLFFRLYTAILVLFFFVLIETSALIILKVMDQGTSTKTGKRHLYHPYRSHQLNPNYFRMFDTGGKKIHSPDGFRSNATFNKLKAPGTFRIIMMGGSTLYGIGATNPYNRTPTLQNDETISHFLELDLQSKLLTDNENATIEIINTAVSAYTTFHHLIYFNEVLYEYDADLVVFLDGHNDFYYSKIYNNWQSYKLGTVRLVDHYNHRGFWFTTHTLVRYLANYSRFFFFLESFMHRNWETTQTPVFYQPIVEHDDNFPATLDTVQENTIFKSYTQFKTLSDIFGFEMMVFLQPQVVFENPDLLSIEDQTVQEITLQHDSNTRRATIRSLLDASFKHRDIEFHDVAELATADTRTVQLYTDYCHLTPAGSETLAARMSQPIYEKVKKMLEDKTAEK